MLKRVTSTGNYIGEIDGLRFLAVVPVVLMHLSERVQKYSLGYDDSLYDSILYYLSRGTVGVFLFFAISGFILGMPFAKCALSGKKPKSYKIYLKRRFVRLEPPYIFWMLIFFTVLVIRDVDQFQYHFKHLIASVFYVHNIIYNSYSTINPVAWSLEVELQFYLLAPFIFKIYFLIKNFKVRTKLLGVIVVLYPFVKSLLGWHSMPLKATLLGNLDFFLIGLLALEIYLAQARKVNMKKTVVWDVVGLISIILLFNSWSSNPILGLFLNVSILGIIISAFNGKYLNQLMNLKWVTLIGGMCYTIYLIHLPLMEFIISFSSQWSVSSDLLIQILLQSIIVLPILMVIVVFAYVLIERPFMGVMSISTLFKNIFINLSMKKHVFVNRLRILTSSFWFLLLICFCNFNQMMGQSDVNKSLVRFNVEETGYIELLPLEDIIYLAQENSPLLKSTDYSLLNIDAEIKLIKQKWTEYLSLSGSYIYGTSSYLDQSETVFEVDYSTLNRKSIFYHVGVSVRIPLSVITNQKHKVMIAENDKRINLLQKDDALMKLRQSVISYYTTFNNRMRVLKVKNDKLQSLELASQYAEKALKAGQLEILEYSRIATERAQANEEIENVRSEASLAFLILSDLTGESIRIK